MSINIRNIRQPVFIENTVSEDQQKSEKIKNIISFIFSLVVLFGFSYILINQFAYFDPINFCYINTNGSVYEDDNVAKSALKYLKNNDQDGYDLVCKNIEVINEMVCREKYVSYERGKNDGCYIKGSKIVYITPTGLYQDDHRQIEDIAESLKIFAGYSRDFWEEKRY